MVGVDSVDLTKMDFVGFMFGEDLDPGFFGDTGLSGDRAVYLTGGSRQASHLKCREDGIWFLVVKDDLVLEVGRGEDGLITFEGTLLVLLLVEELAMGGGLRLFWDCCCWTTGFEDDAPAGGTQTCGGSGGV